MGPAHGQEAQEKPHRLRRLPCSRPWRATNRDNHAIVTGEPDARKASPSGSGGNGLALSPGAPLLPAKTSGGAARLTALTQGHWVREGVVGSSPVRTPPDGLPRSSATTATVAGSGSPPVIPPRSTST